MAKVLPTSSIATELTSYTMASEFLSKYALGSRPHIPKELSIEISSLRTFYLPHGVLQKLLTLDLLGRKTKNRQVIPFTGVKWVRWPMRLPNNWSVGRLQTLDPIFMVWAPHSTRCSLERRLGRFGLNVYLRKYVQ